MPLRYLVVNAKNYSEASGDSVLSLASDALSVEQEYSGRVKVFLALPAFSMQLVSKNLSGLDLLAQHLDDSVVGSTTGFLVPEIAKMCGCKGSLINHSEHRIPEDQITKIVAKLKSLDMLSVVCSRDDLEVGRHVLSDPDFIAIEPPELIGSGVAVSRARPEVISDSVKSLDKSRRPDSRTRLLCGAGIVDETDAKKAVELGSEGVLVASGVIKAKDWRAKMAELAGGLSDARGTR